MKKYIVGGFVLIFVIGIVLYVNDQSKSTTFGEVFEEVFKEKEITRVVIEDKQNAKIVDSLIFEDQERFNEIIDESKGMKIKETGIPPMNTYEITIYYTDGDEEKMTAIVVGYNNTLQMVDSNFYKIEDRNFLFESIRREFDLR